MKKVIKIPATTSHSDSPDSYRDRNGEDLKGSKNNKHIL